MALTFVPNNHDVSTQKALTTNPDNAVRSIWKIGSHCEVYSNTSQSWHKARITNIFTDCEGEWLDTNYTVHKTTRCRQVYRYDLTTIRPTPKLPSKAQSPSPSSSTFGHMQSPINIITNSNSNKLKTISDTEFQTNPLQFNYPSTLTNCSILNNGHTVQINIDAMNKCTVSIHNKVYELKQFHFHTPSEHTIDSNTFDMEMHLVHMNTDNEIAVLGFIFSCEGIKSVRPKLEFTKSRMHLFIPQTNDECCACAHASNGSKTVSPVLEDVKEMPEINEMEEIQEEWKSEYDMDDLSTDSDISTDCETGNEFLDQFWTQLPKRKTVKDIPLMNTLSFDYLFETAANNMIKSVDTNEMNINMEIFEYEGSLTTPPYTEGVQWLVSKKLHFINKSELRTLSSCWNYTSNARPVQECFGRRISLRSKSSLLRNL